jgi:hypothetical protein
MLFQEHGVRVMQQGLAIGPGPTARSDVPALRARNPRCSSYGLSPQACMCEVPTGIRARLWCGLKTPRRRPGLHNARRRSGDDRIGHLVDRHKPGRRRCGSRPAPDRPAGRLRTRQTARGSPGTCRPRTARREPLGGRAGGGAETGAGETARIATWATLGGVTGLVADHASKPTSTITVRDGVGTTDARPRPNATPSRVGAQLWVGTSFTTRWRGRPRSTRAQQRFVTRRWRSSWCADLSCDMSCAGKNRRELAITGDHSLRGRSPRVKR